MYYNHYNEQMRRANELGIAIPYTGRRHPGHYDRQPRNIGTNSERTFDYEENREYTFKNIKRVPNSYDDLPFANYGMKNWKKFRKHQWKE